MRRRRRNTASLHPLQKISSHTHSRLLVRAEHLKGALSMKLVLLALLCFSSAAFSATKQAEIVDTLLRDRATHYFDLYKDLHQYPELGNKEVETSKKMAAQLKALGINVIENIGGTGLVGVISNGTGPIGMLRAD